MNKTLIVILGPTAIGKTAISIHLAKLFSTEIISSDSRQFFKELNIGTAKPSSQELSEVKHHLINSIFIHDDYNVGQFEADALKCLEEIFLKHHVAVMCGGSGLYINAVCHGMDELPESNPEIRNELNNLLLTNGIEALQNKLKELDEEYFSTVDLKNPHRLIRAIEVCMITGLKYSSLRKQHRKERPFRYIKIGLEDEREKIYERINKRVDKMMEAGLLKEAETLYPFRHLNALQTVGYKELFEYIDKRISLDEAIDLIKRNTRNYAKRQFTFFKRDDEINWFNPAQAEGIIDFIKRALN